MKHLFIINPAAGSRNQTEIYRKKIAKECEARGLEYSIEVSGAPGQCKKIANRAARTGDEYRIYACGGDGTLNEVVSGVAGFQNVAITMFAGGSGNDFIRIFDDPEAFRHLSCLLDAEEATFDLIRCNDDYSLNICSVGFDARVGTDVANYKRIPLLSGFRAYAASAVINTIRGVSEHYVVEVDGERFDGKYTLVCACNGRFYGGGFNPVPQADPADGKLEVLLVRAPVDILELSECIMAVQSQKYNCAMITFRSASQVRVYASEEMPWTLDGEKEMGRSCIDVRNLHHAVRLMKKG